MRAHTSKTKSPRLHRLVLGMDVGQGKNYEEVRNSMLLDVPIMKSSHLKPKLLRYWTYFRRGHGVYLAFALSFLNFAVIQWRLLIEQVDFLEALFQHFYVFTIIFFVTYVPLATIIGWIDYKRGAMPVDLRLGAKASPWAQDLAKAIILLAEGKNQEVVEIMKKWARK